MYFYESNYHLELYQYSIIEIDSISNLINFHKDKIKSSNYLSILKKNIQTFQYQHLSAYLITNLPYFILLSEHKFQEEIFLKSTSKDTICVQEKEKFLSFINVKLPYEFFINELDDLKLNPCIENINIDKIKEGVFLYLNQFVFINTSIYVLAENNGSRNYIDYLFLKEHLLLFKDENEFNALKERKKAETHNVIKNLKKEINDVDVLLCIVQDIISKKKDSFSKLQYSFFETFSKNIHFKVNTSENNKNKILFWYYKLVIVNLFYPKYIVDELDDFSLKEKYRDFKKKLQKYTK